MARELGQLRVLADDDQRLGLIVLERTLRLAGVQDVCATTDPVEALSLFAEFEPDLVLVDLQMQPFDGLELMRRLRARCADAVPPVVVLSADESPETRRRALAAGADDFIVKPFVRADVLRRVSDLVEMSASGHGDHQLEVGSRPSGT